jgi:hypothetical protein
MPASTPTTTRFVGAASVAVLLLLSGACSDGDDEVADDDVATLGDGDDGSLSEDDGGSDDTGGGQGGRAADTELQDALLDFAECMREHGIDMDDPQIGDGGMVIIRGGPGRDGGDGPPSEAEQEEMEAADEACGPILEEARGSMPEIDPEQEAELQEQALEFAECMREHGIDMPDPVFDEDGGMTQRVGDGEGAALDPTDEDFQEAAEECGRDGGFIGAPPAEGEE